MPNRGGGSRQAKPTSAERFWASVHRGGLLATGAALASLLGYVCSGALLVGTDVLAFPYPFLGIGHDPVLHFLVAGTGLFIAITMVGFVFSVLLAEDSEEDVVVVVLASVAIGLGTAAFYHSFKIFIRLVE